MLLSSLDSSVTCGPIDQSVKFPLRQCGGRSRNRNLKEITQLSLKEGTSVDRPTGGPGGGAFSSRTADDNLLCNQALGKFLGTSPVQESNRCGESTFCMASAGLLLACPGSMVSRSISSRKMFEAGRGSQATNGELVPGGSGKPGSETRRKIHVKLVRDHQPGAVASASPAATVNPMLRPARRFGRPRTASLTSTRMIPSRWSYHRDGRE